MSLLLSASLTSERAQPLLVSIPAHTQRTDNQLYIHPDIHIQMQPGDLSAGTEDSLVTRSLVEMPLREIFTPGTSMQTHSTRDYTHRHPHGIERKTTPRGRDYRILHSLSLGRRVEVESGESVRSSARGGDSEESSRRV